MEIRWIVAVAAIGIAQASTAQPLADYESVLIVSLIAAPERYDGKKISVSGWMNLKLENMSLCSTKVAPKVEECVWLNLEEKSALTFETRKWQWREHDGGLVTLQGVFSKDNRGHFGMWPGALEKIEHLSAVPIR